MPLVRSALIATAACLIGAVAYAQPTTGTAPAGGSTSVPQTPPDNNQAGPPPATSDMGSQNGDVNGQANGQMNEPAQPGQPMQGAQTGSEANTSATVNGDVIASQPVPDTRANRKLYGQPLSRAGRRTAPTGD
ncbi:MAG: hypothetical protein ACREEW_12700 [Caulobacteraceae bacterium]